ncbi:GntR family transcriptional regulator [Pseudonocardia sulfidoxydans NBRC 16205]|uniref:GntR family transcriptional regulator n=1 Tax=Pseudonocardia sulfidoxydans NBRC 16205 TaxID=1223511 RepID=A0A511DJ57_9PSEU|nr:GntR family transcriptional regulator [Pseudonocardia sulfidoxydans]GEL23804.1 GntR family transcriptional regulator [Pseudonocardia sulfidoxydans NBRC 16205]
MLFRIDPSRPVLLADQIAANVRRGIAEGTVAPGERLPPARELAASLDVSIHTVLAGYQQLRDEQLIELRRGRGATVREGLRPDRAALLGLVHDLVAAARRIDLDDEELVDLVRSAAAGS